ncbi:MAG TPA: hypothetical protein PLA94_15420, partial [Myxococcota bacterium]|nr:hypothetical protein [Myxococcota bacterium]
MLPLLLACGPPVAAEAPVVVPLVPANPVALAEGVRLYVDRDSIADAFPLGDRVVQRTPGGVIVVRRRDLSVERVVLGPAPAAAIGPDGDRVLAAWADGGTATLDPETGVLTKGPTVTGAPIWVGRAGDRVVVALGDDLAVAVLNLDTGARRSGRIRVDTPVPLGRPDAMVASPAAAPLSTQVTGQGPPRSARNQRSVEDVGGGNSQGRGPALWLGWDNGEWGGVIARVDLRDGHVDARGAANISGFTMDGERVLAFGGVDHLGMRDGWIGVAGSPDDLFSHGSYGPTKPGPDAPIHHVLPTPTGFTVLSFSDVWETDATFTTWRKAGELRVH